MGANQGFLRPTGNLARREKTVPSPAPSQWETTPYPSNDLREGLTNSSARPSPAALRSPLTPAKAMKTDTRPGAADFQTDTADRGGLAAGTTGSPRPPGAGENVAFHGFPPTGRSSRPRSARKNDMGGRNCACAGYAPSGGNTARRTRTGAERFSAGRCAVFRLAAKQPGYHGIVGRPGGLAGGRGGRAARRSDSRTGFSADFAVP